MRRFISKLTRRLTKKKAKENFIKKYGRLYCELCGFSFEKTYGELGKNFIEVHHYKPISYFKENEITCIENLKIVCSNCHRMIHKGEPLKNYDAIQDIFEPMGR